MGETRIPTEEEFRKAGFTIEALKYPLSPEGIRFVAQFNGIKIEQMPETWKYAPNPTMQEYCHKKGLEL
jgi:hypothetical protein